MDVKQIDYHLAIASFKSALLTFDFWSDEDRICIEGLQKKLNEQLQIKFPSAEAK